ncbi:hypothetical protein RJ640_030597 [Escallonia rubra]|uniref:Protein PHLOEM PROTEIN 2-LIKE A10 n=1 Tax=Escallonia rubra TaxID=112253 RepID=A0AA88UG42_9ASTE|nr:hypothetical protein RJ640_030597 [Escallonia rubra]
MNFADLRLVNKGLDYAQKRKRWVFLVAALGFSGYGAYKVYNSPSVVNKRKRLLKLLGALTAIAEAVGDSAEAIGIVSKDVKEFIESDSDQIPSSLRQISKITRSDEFSESVIKITRALAVGILRGYKSEAGNGDLVSEKSSFSDQVFGKLFSSAGSGFASAVVGSFARNMVMGFYSGGQSNGEPEFNGLENGDGFDSDSDSIPRWVDVVCDHKCRELIGDCIQLFVSTAVSVYLDKTMEINTYEEIFTGLTNPKHEKKVRDMLASVCNGAVETLVRTSHQVLTAKSSDVDSNSNPAYLAIGVRRSPNNVNEKSDRRKFISTELKGRKSFDDNQDAGWVTKMSSSLAVPSNRRFVLDMTGRVTFETVRSFLEFSVEKLSEGLKTSLNSVHEEVVDMGIEVFNLITARSSTVVTICLSLCLHILNGPWILVPA